MSDLDPTPREIAADLRNLTQAQQETRSELKALTDAVTALLTHDAADNERLRAIKEEVAVLRDEIKERSGRGWQIIVAALGPTVSVILTILINTIGG